MQPAARQYYRAAFMAFEHAKQHADVASDLDAAQVILSLDFGVEMLLKAVLLDRSESIVEKPGRTIGLVTALKRAGSYKNGSSVEILRDRRDSLQHAAQYTDAATTADLFEAALLFVTEVLKTEFPQELPPALLRSVSPTERSPSLVRVHDSTRLQRDIAVATDGSIAWAEGVPNSSELAVHVLAPDGETEVLTPAGAFEYMPVIGSGKVAAYRQSGGVVLYDLGAGDRSILSETGGPTDIRGDLIAAQGLGVEGGLAGGIHLYDMRSRSWTVISEAGDSASLTEDFVYWQMLEDDRMVIKRRRLDADDEGVIVADRATHLKVSDRFLAWCDWPGGAEPNLHIADLDGAEVRECGVGIFPDTLGDRVAFLRPARGSYDLVVVDIPSGKVLIEVSAVGFPVGHGPVLAASDVYLEARNGLPTHGLWRIPLQ